MAESEPQTFETENWTFEKIAPHEYVGTPRGTTKYITMTGLDVDTLIYIPKTHKLKTILLYHTTSGDVYSKTDINVYLFRSRAALGKNFEYILNTTNGPRLLAGYITLIFPPRTREASIYTLRLNATNTHRIYPLIYVSIATGETEDAEGMRPQLVLDGEWQEVNTPFYLSLTTQATTNAYATLSAAQLIENLDALTIVLTETVGQNVMYSIDASMDNTIWVNLKTNQDLAASTNEYETLTDLWRYIRIQIIDKVAGTHGSVAAQIYGRRMARA